MTSPPFIGGATGIVFVAVDNKYDGDGIIIDAGILRTGSGNRMFIAGMLGIVVALTAANPNTTAMTPIVVIKSNDFRFILDGFSAQR